MTLESITVVTAITVVTVVFPRKDKEYSHKRELGGTDGKGFRKGK